MALEATEFELSLEGLEAESEAAERAPIRRPSSQPSFRPRPAGVSNPVTQMQLESALTRVDGKIKTVSDSLGTITSRLAVLGSATKKETAERKKAEDSQGKDLNQKIQMLTLLPLLIQQPTATLAPGNGLLPGGRDLTQVSTPDTNQLDALLPLLLISGLGGSFGGPSLGGDGSGSDSSLMLLALVLAFARPRTT
jgi:hypothetical protein